MTYYKSVILNVILKQKEIKILSLVLIFLFSCNNNKNSTPPKIITNNNVIKSKTPNKNKINPDSLLISYVGQDGVLNPENITVSNPRINKKQNYPIIPGVSYLEQTEEDIILNKKLIKSKLPQIREVINKKKYQLIKTDTFSIQYGDTIYPVKKYNIEKQNVITEKIDLITDRKFSIQYGDTIYAPIKVFCKQPQPNVALPPRYRDKAILDIQYLDVDQGLASSNVWAMLEDKIGNIWFSTDGGVSRYDGKNFINYTTNEGLNNYYILTMLEDKDGKLWFGTDGGGISCLDGEIFTHYTPECGLNTYDINSIIEDKKGSIWFASDGGGVFKYDKKSFTNYTLKNGLCNDNVKSIIEDKKGNIWFASDGGGVSCFDGESFINYNTENGLVNNNISTLAEDKNGNIWIGTFDGSISCFDGEKFTNYTKENGLGDKKISTILIAKNGIIWFGTDRNGVYIFNGESFIHYIKKDGLNSNSIRSLLEDKSGNIWFGTNGNGVSRYNERSFRHFTTEEGLSNNVVKAITKDTNGNIWFGTYGGGVCVYDGEQFTNYTTEQGLCNNYIRSLAKDNMGRIWIGTKNGVSCFDGKSFTNYTTENGLSNNSIRSIIVDKDDLVWFGTYGNGISSFDGEKFTCYLEKDGLASNFVKTLIEDKKGNIWIGTYRNGVSCFDGSSFTNYTTEEGLNNDYIRSLYEDKKGNIWIGSYGGGLSSFDGEIFTHYTVEQGLSNNIVRSIIEDNSARIWITTEKGISVLVTNNAKNELNNSKIFTFNKLDGLKGLDFNSNSVCIDDNNKLWWGSGKSVTMLNLNNFKFPKEKPVIQLNSIDINQQFIDFHALKRDSVNEFDGIKYKKVLPFYNYPLDLKLPYSLNHITFNFSAIDWGMPHKIQYTYMLVGLDKTWSPYTKECKADYRNIPYGKYTFKVKAISTSNKWSNIIEYKFTVYPPWWHTWWARTLYVIIGILIIFIYIKIRIAKLKQKQKELENTVEERTHEVVQQKHEIEEKNEELNQLLEEIITQRDEIESQRNSVQKQKELVEIINKEVSQSIDYATRIQQAILPEKKILKKYFDKHFVLFKPKDRVSGDFYWWTHIEGNTVITAADCTGHGVPGAFMSMLGVSFLREIVQKEYITHPGVILRKLRKEVIKSLKQKGESGEQKDGMDMSLVSINSETNILQFAGANNPLYIITENELSLIDNDNENNALKLIDNSVLKVESSKLMYEVKPDKMPIAIYVKMDNFVTHEIQLQKGDQIYMFSDGFADQFGGPKGKKFKYKPFKRLILENAEKSMEEQKQILSDTFDSWRGDIEQVDDVVVLCVKI